MRDGRGRRPLVQWLEEARIETRELFGGHILRQPAYADAGIRVHGELPATCEVVENAFFVGVYPGLTPAMVEYVVETFARYFRRH